jgi:glycine dehydrogenase subunit 1
MLEVIGLESEEALFDSVPDALKIDSLDLPDGVDEYTAFAQFQAMAAKNSSDKVCFLGGGYYDHIIPAAVDALSMRSEFYTAYTPYQAEASQGTLQALYEYQSLICRLTGMEVSNASMYDGATALAEAALMAVRITKRNKILIDSGVNPQSIKIVQTYLSFRDIELEVVEGVNPQIDESVAGYLFQNPNFYGSVKDFTAIIEQLHAVKALAVMSTYPIALAKIKDPASMGVDIVTADGQSLGNYLSFGGPSFGIIATRQQYIRDLPGRIIGKTLDKDGKELFVLTMQAREQHIRRQRATSNICSNQNLMALRATIYLSLMGREGLAEVAALCYQKSMYLKKALSQIEGVRIVNKKPTFNEFAIEVADADNMLDQLKAQGFYAGINLGKLKEERKNQILIAVTEKRTKAEMDQLVAAIGGAL